MTYVEQTWHDNDPSAPASAARLGHMELGIGDAHDQLAALESVSVAAGLRGDIAPSDPGMFTTGGRTLTSSTTTWLLRFSPQRAWNITLARWEVTVVASTDDSVEVAVYNSDLTSRLATSGVQTGQLNGLGVKGVPLVYTFDPALVYYIAFKAATTTATVIGRGTNTGSAWATLFGTTVPTALIGSITGLSSPLPTSITAGSVGWTGPSLGPMVVLREV